MCSRLLKALVIASEKAANVARLIRKNDHLFELLVQEKTGDSANARFVRDFKTLADVLIQEMVKHDLGALVSEVWRTGDMHDDAKEWQHVTIIDFCFRLNILVAAELVWKGCVIPSWAGVKFRIFGGPFRKL